MYLRECFRRESPPRASELADRLHVSRTWLNKQFAARHGMTVNTFLKQEQLACAKHLLATTNLSITAVAYRAAFGTRRSRHRAFVRETGVTPAEYRQGSSKCL